MNEQETTTMNEQELFRSKAENYLICLSDHCPRHEECLRWQVGQYAPTDTYMLSIINPRNPMTGDGSCNMFRQREKVTVYYGMTHFYDDIPEPKAKAIRHALERKLKRTNYYECRRGDRPITPAFHSIIEETARNNGWQGPLVFEREEKDYDW